MAAATILDEAQGYRDDSGFENGHTLLKDKLAADKEGFAALNAKAVAPEEGASFTFGLIADQDEASKVDEGGAPFWISKLAIGKLTFSSGAYTLALDSEATLKSTRGDNPKQLSMDLCVSSLALAASLTSQYWSNWSRGRLPDLG